VKELPYFRFTVQEWQNGDITLENYEAQGVFINACAYYWISNCSLKLDKLKRRLRGAEATLSSLIESGVIKVNQDDYISIKFLDEQLGELTKKSLELSNYGKKGYLAKLRKAQGGLKGGYKGGLSNKDKDNEKESPTVITPEEDKAITKGLQDAQNGIYPDV